MIQNVPALQYFVLMSGKGPLRRAGPSSATTGMRTFAELSTFSYRTTVTFEQLTEGVQLRVTQSATVEKLMKSMRSGKELLFFETKKCDFL
jgi:hypothetical protein